MPKKRRYNSANLSDSSATPDKKDTSKENDFVGIARGRFKGALMDAIDPNAEDTDVSLEHINHKIDNDSRYSTPLKRNVSDLLGDLEDSSSDKGNRRGSSKKRALSPHRNTSSYVMKLFDRSVDLAQFKEDTPLYPICRAWMANQPKNNFRPKSVPDTPIEDLDGDKKVELPPPEGPPVPRVPPLLNQYSKSKQNINLNYDDNPPISKEDLLMEHKRRWFTVRKRWYEQAVKYEARYSQTQEVLNEMDTNS